MPDRGRNDKSLCHREERSDVAIFEIAALRSQ